MKKTLKVLSLVLALAMVAAIFTGCPAGDKIQEIDEDAIKDYTFRVSAYRNFGDDPLNMGYADGANEFLERYPESNVEYLTVGDHDPASIASAIAAGDVWDIQYVFTCVRHPGDIVDGLYDPIDGYYDPNDERIDEEAMRNAYFDGHYYGISNNHMNEINYFTYNENVFKENGIKTPHEYYAEGKWNLDSFMEMCKALDEKDLKMNNGNFGRPDWILNRATKWNDEYTEVEIILDSNQTRQDLDKFKTILYDYDMLGSGTVTKREVAISADVMPNIIKTNNTAETTDTLRYIYIPSSDPEKAGPHTYFTDDAFLTPAGSNQDVKAAAVELAICMGVGRKNYLDNYYQENMTEEDYKLFNEALANGAPMARPFNEFPYTKFAFFSEMKTGKSVSTYVSEITGQLESFAENFDKKLADYRESTGLGGEEK